MAHDKTIHDGKKEKNPFKKLKERRAEMKARRAERKAKHAEELGHKRKPRHKNVNTTA